MKTYTTRLYQQSDRKAWNDLIAKAKNATFLFDRDFMEYHRERFSDFSLLVFEGQKLVAALPANRVDDTVFSHQGLTYGGLVYTESLKLSEVLKVFQSLLQFLQQENILSLQLKILPSIYHQKPAQELEYMLFLTQAKLLRRDTLAVVDLSKPQVFSTLRKRGIKKGSAQNLEIREETDFQVFWKRILIPNLLQKHGTTPVHSAQEMERLRVSFPGSIRQFNVYKENEIIAGATIFETETVAHAQYISADESRDETGSLDFLFAHLLEKVFKGKRFFDFGISNENQGKNLNAGLSYWKESFGTGTVVHDFYEVNPAAHELLNDVLL